MYLILQRSQTNKQSHIFMEAFIAAITTHRKCTFTMTVDDFKCRMRGHLYNPESIAAIALRRKITEFEEILFNSLNFSFGITHA
ncbi:hypothetical protein DXD89_13115 [Butyricicoccus sp. TM10-16AC]|nr:hypothetical protein DWZ82_14630 [Butyricicoccus sp. AF35-5AC]RHU16210.1 hypothetical protein DXD89_13115 [Butyricicoccus sp. TM10-16AC]